MANPNQRIILKLSGEALGENGKLFNHEAFEAAARMLIRVRQSGAELAVVIGGGNVWRGRRGPAQRMGAVAADQMGMLATLQNSLYIQIPSFTRMAGPLLKAENITTQMIKRPKAGWKLMASITALVP